MELSLLDYNYIRFLPSITVLSYFVARFTLEPTDKILLAMDYLFLILKNQDAFSLFQGLKIQWYSVYKPFELKDCVLAFHDLRVVCFFIKLTSGCVVQHKRIIWHFATVCFLEDF